MSEWLDRLRSVCDEANGLLQAVIDEAPEEAKSHDAWDKVLALKSDVEALAAYAEAEAEEVEAA